jgi:hypothetical protein
MNVIEAVWTRIQMPSSLASDPFARLYFVNVNRWWLRVSYPESVIR